MEALRDWFFAALAQLSFEESARVVAEWIDEVGDVAHTMYLDTGPTSRHQKAVRRLLKKAK